MTLWRVHAQRQSERSVGAFPRFVVEVVSVVRTLRIAPGVTLSLPMPYHRSTRQFAAVGLASGGTDSQMTVSSARRRPPIPRDVSAAIRQLLRRLDRAEQLHASDVSFYALMIGESLDFTPEMIRQVACGALLHDIGKIAIPLDHRDHSGGLTALERLNMLTHPEVGEAMVSVHAPLAQFADLVRHHHERYDGRGYPDELAGSAIPIEAAVLAVSEAFATMITEQPYQKARTWHEALGEIRAGSGTQFHPSVSAAFLVALGELPTTRQ